MPRKISDCVSLQAQEVAREFIDSLEFSNMLKEGANELFGYLGESPEAVRGAIVLGDMLNTLLSEMQEKDMPAETFVELWMYMSMTIGADPRVRAAAEILEGSQVWA